MRALDRVYSCDARCQRRQRVPRTTLCSAALPGSQADTRARRRALLLSFVVAPALSTVSSVHAATPGQVGAANAGKRTGLSDAEVMDVLGKSLADGKYFVNSRGMAVDVFRDDCAFVDPTNSTVGLQKYMTALDLLFDPEHSTVKLLDIHVAAPRRIEATWTLGGYLKFPWHPFVPDFEGTATYTLDTDGLVARQQETWSISPLEALRETFTPTAGPGA